MIKAFARMFKICLSNHKKKGISILERHCLLVSVRTFGLIFVYYIFSIGITFYQKWFIRRFHYPLTIVVCHMFVKFLLAALIRGLYRHFTGTARITLPWRENIRKMSLPGVASALDIGFSNWSFEFITISLYTMTKSTCIIFILCFAILFDLEKMRLSLVVVVSFISVGLFMFTYKSTQFQLNGFLLVLSASMLSGLRWTLSQKLMQRKESSLSNPLDMMYHMQPWMVVGLLPLALAFEVLPTVHGFFLEHQQQQHVVDLSSAAVVAFSVADFWQIVHLILIGSLLAFLMEFSEYLLLTFTSSLTLSMAGIFKEIFTLYLAVNYNGDQMSQLNFIGLLVCLFGISTHVCLKACDSQANSAGDEARLALTTRQNSSSCSSSSKLAAEDSIESTRLLNDDDVIHFDLMMSTDLGGGGVSSSSSSSSSSASQSVKNCI